MSKLIILSLLGIIIMSSYVSCKKNPYDGAPPQKGSVVDYLQWCLYTNYFPDDEEHREFLHDLTDYCGEPYPNRLVEPVTDQLKWVQHAKDCIDHREGPDHVKEQAAASLNCLEQQILAYADSNPEGMIFTEKKSTQKMSHVNKKLKSNRK